MALRVTARLAQRFGIRAPTQGSFDAALTGNRAAGPSDLGPVLPESRAGRPRRCNAKCAVRETVEPAMTAWNWARVFSRCTGMRRERSQQQPGSDGQALAALGAACVDDG